MHPVQGEDRPGVFEDFIEDVGPFLRALEGRRYGRAHLQTVSVFGPELIRKPWLREPIFRHPLLDFASVHLYEEGTIDFPLDTVAPALAIGRLIRDTLAESATAAVLDTEHGPIHTFKDYGRTLPEPFDDEYFRHMQWAHFASGAVGGGMRWPNRDPHVLTPGDAPGALALARFLPLIDWPRFRRRNLHRAVGIEGGGVACFACGDEHQALLWLLRTDCIAENGRVYRDGRPARVRLPFPDSHAAVTASPAGIRCAADAVDTAELDHRGGMLTSSRLASPPTSRLRFAGSAEPLIRARNGARRPALIGGCISRSLAAEVGHTMTAPAPRPDPYYSNDSCRAARQTRHSATRRRVRDTSGKARRFPG